MGCGLIFKTKMAKANETTDQSVRLILSFRQSKTPWQASGAYYRAN